MRYSSSGFAHTFIINLAGVRANRHMPILLLPAELGLLWHIKQTGSLADRLLLIALALFCLELMYMAQVDFKMVYLVRCRSLSSKEPQGLTNIDDLITTEVSDINLKQASHSVDEDSRLTQFYLAVVSTVILEIIGFYTALYSLAPGAAIILFSQLWFNLSAGVQLFPEKTPAIVSFGIIDRVEILLADTAGLALLLCWPIASLRVWLAGSLLGLITLFLFIKYGSIVMSYQRPVQK